MKYAEILRNVSFDDIWSRLADTEKFVCCTRGSDTGWETSIMWDPRERYVAEHESSADGLNRFVREEQQHGRRIFGYLSHDFGYALHGLKPRAQNDLKLPDILFYSYDAYIVCRQDEIEIHATDFANLSTFVKSVKEILSRVPAAGVACARNARASTEFRASATLEEYARSFENVKQHILAGDIYQMNLTHRLEGRTKKPSRKLFSALWDKNHADFSAYIEAGDFEILSASPERFISVSADYQIDPSTTRSAWLRGEKRSPETRSADERSDVICDNAVRIINTFPIKGTRPRGASAIEDERLRDELTNSEKETAELTMITDLLRNDIGKVCEFGTVRVVSVRIVRAFASVWHAYSHITGICAQGVRAIDALIAMFPGGSVTGCPKRRAMEIIDELEPTVRGVYAGSIGYIDSDDSADFNIAIRTLIKKGNRVYLQVGGGIVYDSVEKDEYEETLDKARSFLGIL